MYDDFEDDFSREGLETRITHLQPAELLIPRVLSSQTARLLDRLCPSQVQAGNQRTTVELIENDLWDLDSALLIVSEFYGTNEENTTECTKEGSFVSFKGMWLSFFCFFSFSLF